MSFYGLVLAVTLLMISVYIGAFLEEMSNSASIANSYSLISERILQMKGQPSGATHFLFSSFPASSSSSLCPYLAA